jgi:diamine N-acetyltransferase
MNKPIVSLRAIEPEDLNILYQIENDEELWDVGVTNVPYSRYTLHNYIAQSAGDIYSDRQVRLMIENETREIIGIVDIVNFNPQHLRAEIGIVIQKPWRNKHYATATLDKLVNYAQKVLHLHQLYACIASSNEVSLALFKNCGFQRSAILREWLFDGYQYHDVVLVQKKI